MNLIRKKLGDITLNITDGEHNTVVDTVGTNYFLLSNKNIIDGQIKITEEDRTISKDVLDKIQKRTKIEFDDVIISTVGTIGKVAIIKDKNINYDFQRSVGIIKCDNTKILPEYLMYYLTVPFVQERLQKLSKGAIQKCLYINDLSDLDIDLPEDVKDQYELVKSLVEIDNQISRNNDMVQKLQVLAQSTYSRWFNQFEFPNEEGFPYKSNKGKFEYNGELKREIPVDWKVKELGEILQESDKSKVQVGEAKENFGKFPFFTSGEDIILYKDAFVDGPYCYLNTGGNADVKFFEGKSSYSTDTWCISFDKYTYMIKEYLLFIKPSMDKLFFSGSGLKHLQKEAFKKQKVLIPDDNILDQFNKIVEVCNKQSSQLYLQNIELNNLKSKLLPLLINGQLEM